MKNTHRRFSFSSSSRLLSWMFLIACFITSLSSFAEQEEAQPITINFTEIQPDWWTNWESYDTEKKQSFLSDITKQYITFGKQMSEASQWHQLQSSTLAEIDQIDALLLDSTQEQHIEIPTLEPSTVITWSKLFNLENKQKMLVNVVSKDLKTRYRTVVESLESLRSQYVVYRDLGENAPEKSGSGAQLFASQIQHLRTLQEYENAKKSHINVTNGLALLKNALGESLQNLNYSLEAQEELQTNRKVFDSQIKTIEQKKAKTQKKLLSKKIKKDRELSLQLALLDYEIQTLQILIQIDLNNILSDTNYLLRDDSSPVDIIWEKKIKAHRESLQVLEEKLSFFHLQLLNLSYYEKKSKDDEKLWKLYENSVRNLTNIEPNLKIADDYKKMLGRTFANRKGWTAVLRSKWQSWQDELKVKGQSVLNYPLFTINESPVTPADMIQVVLILVIAILVSSSIRKTLASLVDKYDISESTVFTVGRVLHYTIITAAIFIGLSSIGLDFTKFALVAGALSVGIGFGLQSIFNNFVSGIILLFERPLKVGDIVELESGVKGYIRAINVRSTRVTTRDNIDILVPNSEFVNGRVTNYTFADPMRRIHIPFKVAFGSEKEKVREAGLEAASNVRFTSQSRGKTPDVWLMSFGDSCLNFALVVWVNSHRAPNDNYIYAMYNWQLDTSLRKHGIEIPIPYHRVFHQEIPPDYPNLFNREGSASPPTNEE